MDKIKKYKLFTAVWSSTHALVAIFHVMGDWSWVTFLLYSLGYCAIIPWIIYELFVADE